MIFWAVVFAPAIIFYLLLVSGYVNIPNSDDYTAVLAFANQYVQQHAPSVKALQIVTYQQSEYKTMLVNAVVAAQCELLHRVSLPMLILLGNLMPAAIFFTVLAMWKRKPSDSAAHLLYFLPISFLVFQLQYCSTLDWATAGMQNLPVILCSLLAILFLTDEDSRGLVIACCWLVVAICSSANGFGFSIVGGVLLIQQRRWRHMLLWTTTTLAMGALYSFKYQSHSSQSVPGATVTQAFLHFNLLYALSFLGTSIAGFSSYVPSVALGSLLLCLFVYICFTGYSRSNPRVFYAMMFIVLSAFGVAGLRGALGVTQSLASRYRIYSNLMLALVFIYLVESVLPHMRLKPKAEKSLLAAVAFVCLLFCLASDWAGLRLIKGRREALIYEMAHWQRPAETQGMYTSSMNPALERQLRLGIYKPITQILNDSIRLRVYEPRRIE